VEYEIDWHVHTRYPRHVDAAADFVTAVPNS